MNRLMFFYGTLMRGDSRGGTHTRLGVEFVGPAKIRGDLVSVGDSFPGYVAGEGEIVGQVWMLPEHPASIRLALATYDGIEGYSERDPERSMYVREEVALLEDPDGRKVQTYRWNRDNDPYVKPIPGGSWAEYASTLSHRSSRLAQDDAEPDEVDGEYVTESADEWEGWAA